ncbi:MAG: ROK family protein [Nannocystaceae bacterium]|nr:ROK family protein [Nannocystaceae bacterium]
MRLGIDLGGTKTEIIAIDEAGAERLRRRVPTPAHDYAAIIATITALVDETEAALGVRGTVGVGIPGSLSPRTTLVRNSNTVCCNGKPLGADLGRALGREVRVANDANCFALSEARDGAARGATVAFGVILGTGCGAGIVVREQVLLGRHGIAGEWGHDPLPWPRADELDPPACYCGRRGCIEAWISGPALLADHRRHDPDTSVADVPALARAAAAGDAAAAASLQRHTDRTARALACVVNVLDPDVVVIGGGLGQLPQLVESLPAAMQPWIFCDYADVRVVRPLHGDSSGVRGAAWLW